ncbi:hypothetical protein [Paraferrimonas sp. SM1919]|uniref:hypothetical protein n=1 Tax=Paraferrimonas sp. SM1919 TaxID=2662263 RepID=UPI0013D6914D|nr:hypothetical protein [Paraferrimonas sp. SM1919]
MKALLFILLSVVSFGGLAKYNLSGVWVGVFSYEQTDGMPPESFTLVLKENKNFLTGMITEPNEGANSDSGVFVADVSGFVSNKTVIFTKQYQAGQSRNHSVTYELTIESPGFLVGSWKINNKRGGRAALMALSGPFLYEELLAQ